MPAVARQDLPLNLSPYANHWEHISDELRCLDLRLRREVMKQPRGQAADPLSPFRGLVITDEQISDLFASTQNEDGGADHAKLEQCLLELQQAIQTRRAASRDAGVSLSLQRLAQIFNLTQFEEWCLIICLAPEIDAKYETLYAYLQNDATRKKPTIGLILNLLCRSQGEKFAARVAFEPSTTLLKFKLLQITDSSPDGQAPLLSRTLKVDDRIASFLLGHNHMDSRLDRFARMVFPGEGPVGMVASHELYHRTSGFVEAHFKDVESVGGNVVLYLHGPANLEKRSIIEAVCKNHTLPLLVADVEAMQAGAMPFYEAVWLLGREAVLRSAVLCLENGDCILAEQEKHRLELNSVLECAKVFSRLTFIFGSRPWQPQGLNGECLFLSISVARPDLGMCKSFWEQSLAACDRMGDDVDSAILAGRFRFGLSQIQDALAAAENMARWRSPEDWRITAADLSAACRAHSSPKLDALAHKITPKYSWNEIVLPEDNLAQLKELCQQARYRHLVYGEWGFDRKLSLGKGLNALFSGPPGTGKTMAAEVIATELQLDLYRIDLSQVVSKYIGETEKNLHQIFLEAETGHAILFFDEADALFGKRSEVKDAHDRYANIEVGYLLQKMEEYEGVAILATNLSQHIDEAFLRRMHFIVEFPFPDHEYRRQIWQVIFPREAPLAREVDFEALAREIKLAGGNIRNIALAAAFYAAGNGRVIQMPHLWQAARREHQKLGRTWESSKSRT
jgi:DNA polymerase III delta prime subunit